MEQIHHTTSKNDRLQVRVDGAYGNLLRRAAAYEHKKLSDFVRDVLEEKAHQIMREHEIVTLSDRDWESFFDALVTPPKPTTALKKAAAKYKKLEI